jgi:hypothetical protein
MTPAADLGVARMPGTKRRTDISDIADLLERHCITCP